MIRVSALKMTMSAPQGRDQVTVEARAEGETPSADVITWRQATAQLMSWPQHIGDLTLPCPSGHFETWTDLPSGMANVSCTSSLPHFPQVIVPTLIPHFGHV